MKIKIAQISDSHIGAKLSYLGHKSKLHREQIKKTFAKSVDLFITSKVDLVLMVGDVFNDPFPIAKDIDFVANQIEKLLQNRVYVMLLAGNHDRNENGGVFNTSKIVNIQNKYFFLASKQTPLTWEIDELSTIIHTYGIERQKDARHPYEIQQLKTDDRFTFNVGAFHGSVDLKGRIPDNYPILLQDMYNAKFDYIALGDWHNLLDVSKDITTQVWYAGAPELVDSDQSKSGNVLLIDLEKGKNPNVKPVQVGSVKVVNLSIDIDAKVNVDNLVQQVKRYGDKSTVLNLSIKGFKSLDTYDLVSDLELALNEYFYHVNVKDYSVLKVSESELAKYPDNMMIGRFIKNMNELRDVEGMDQSVIDEAIQTGVYLLKGGKL